jgi:hypothetical protein
MNAWGNETGLREDFRIDADDPCRGPTYSVGQPAVNPAIRAPQRSEASATIRSRV